MPLPVKCRPGRPPPSSPFPLLQGQPSGRYLDRMTARAGWGWMRRDDRPMIQQSTASPLWVLQLQAGRWSSASIAVLTHDCHHRSWSTVTHACNVCTGYIAPVEWRLTQLQLLHSTMIYSHHHHHHHHQQQQQQQQQHPPPRRRHRHHLFAQIK